MFLDSYKVPIALSLGVLIYPYLLDVISRAFSIREGERKQRTFNPQIDGFRGSLYRAILTLGCVPYKAYISCISIIKAIYRKNVSHKNLLEWMTSEEAEKQSKTDIKTYVKTMFINIITGVVTIIFSIFLYSIL